MYEFVSISYHTYKDSPIQEKDNFNQEEQAENCILTRLRHLKAIFALLEIADKSKWNGSIKDLIGHFNDIGELGGAITDGIFGETAVSQIQDALNEKGGEK